MKKVVVMSDNHGEDTMMDDIKRIEKDADFYVHCGDSEATSEYLNSWIAVKGNNDWMSTLNEEETFVVEDIHFLVAHGHRIPFFDREHFITSLLQQKGCQILLCGHSHVPEHTIIDGYHIINPGSTTLPRMGSNKSYCVITVDQGEVEVAFKTI